jgi:hypothetical protein
MSAIIETPTGGQMRQELVSQGNLLTPCMQHFYEDEQSVSRKNGAQQDVRVAGYSSASMREGEKVLLAHHDKSVPTNQVFRYIFLEELVCTGWHISMDKRGYVEYCRAV